LSNGFDFLAVYGEVGRGYLECHHLLALADLVAARATRLSDVVLVCSNCHRMIHRKRPWLTLASLAGLIDATARRPPSTP
jgi:predicted HNH restriction endonuclease